MEIEHWSIMAKISSDKQAKYFGKYGAFRPYLFFIIELKKLVDDDLIRSIIGSSFYDVPVEDVSYKKYFDLEENETFEYQYTRLYFNDISNRYTYGKFRKITL